MTWAQNSYKLSHSVQLMSACFCLIDKWYRHLQLLRAQLNFPVQVFRIGGEARAVGNVQPPYSICCIAGRWTASYSRDAVSAIARGPLGLTGCRNARMGSGLMASG